MLRIVTNLATLGALLPAVDAILVSPDSPCDVDCGNVLDATTPADIVCDQNAYATTDAGPVYQGCVECELSSSYHQGNQTDVDASLYNVRYAISYCLWGEPKNPDLNNSPCITSKACGLYEDAIKYQNLSTSAGGYDYCHDWPTSDFTDFEGCRECLQASDEQYLANFFTVLQAGCEQKPVTGVLLGLDGDPFSTQTLNITAPSPTASVNPDMYDSGPLSLGAKVGIAVGGLVFVLLCLGCGIVWNGKRKRRAFLRSLQGKPGMGPRGWPSPPQTEMFETPVSQRPLRGWDDSPMTAQSDMQFPRYFSPYSSQYNSPVSAQDALNMQWPAAGVAGPTQEIGLAFGGTQDPNAGQYWATTSSDNKGKGVSEEYEMHHVDTSGCDEGRQHQQEEHPTMLGHPGYGRTPETQPRQYSWEGSGSQGGQPV